MYAGLAPYEALALYAVITYMDSVEGVYVPQGGGVRSGTRVSSRIIDSTPEALYLPLKALMPG